MTERGSFLFNLKENLPESVWPWLISALRQDEIIWDSLNNPKITNTVLEQLTNQPEQWSPIQLVFVIFDHPIAFNITDIDPELRRNAILAYEKATTRGFKESVNLDRLAYSALIAIAFAEQYSRFDSWGRLVVDSEGVLQTDIIRAALAFLYGLVPNRLDFLTDLLVYKSESTQLLDLAIHSVLCTPQPPIAQIKLLEDLLERLPEETRWNFLDSLQFYRPAIASVLAHRSIDFEKIKVVELASKLTNEQFNEILCLLTKSKIHAIAKDSAKSISTQKQALQNLKIFRWNIVAQMLDILSEENKLEDAIALYKQEAINLNEISDRRQNFPIGFLSALWEAGCFTEANEILQCTVFPSENPFAEIQNAFISLNENHIHEARKSAKRAFSHLQMQVNHILSSNSICRVDSKKSLWLQSKVLAKLLSALSLNLEAGESARLGLHLNPNDADSLIIQAQSQRYCGNIQQAMEASQVAVLLEPGSTRNRRVLIECLEIGCEWKQALKERLSLQEKRFAQHGELQWPTIEDLRQLATCALRAEQPELSIELCKGLLRSNPSDGIAHAILGEALLVQGKSEEALQHFQYSTQLSPYQPQPWLALARAWSSSGNAQKAIETLRAASHAVPDNPEIHMALAEIYDQNNSPTNALIALRRAYELVNVNVGGEVTSHKNTESMHLFTELLPQIALRLGQSLKKLGHIQDASQVLANAFQSHPDFPGLAYTYAKCLMDLNRHQEALSPLSIAVETSDENIHPYLEYADILLKLNANPEEAERVLRKALSIDSTNQALRVLLAESLLAKGEFETALKTFYELLETDLAKDPQWQSRISCGLAKVTLELNQPEIALATLKEAVCRDPSNIEIHRLLSKTYMALNLPSESIQSAKEVIRLSPDEVHQLHWFAEQALSLGYQDEAKDALTRAVEVDPERSDLWIKLGELHIHSGEIEKAKSSLLQLMDCNKSILDDLFKASRLFMDMGETRQAIALLNQVIEKEAQPRIEALKLLASAYHHCKEYDKALAILDKIIAIHPLELDPFLKKSQILVSLNRPRAAEAVLDHALNLHPDEWNLVYQKAHIMRVSGKLVGALKILEQWLSKRVQTSVAEDMLAIRGLAADLARSLLQTDYARNLLNEQPPYHSEQGKAAILQEKLEEAYASKVLPFFCLTAELALDAHAEVAAANALNMATEITTHQSPWVMALQARLSWRHNDLATASQILQSALEIIGQEQLWKSEHNPESQSNQEWGTQDLLPQQTLGNVLAVASAAIEMHEWDIALHLLRYAISLAPSEPYPYILLAKTIVLRAEYQKFCVAVGAATHVPGPSSLSEEAFRSFHQAIQGAKDSLSKQYEGLLLEQPLITRWENRGQVVFKPNENNIQRLAASLLEPDDYAALIAAQRGLGKLPTISQYRKATTDQDKVDGSPHILAQLALSIGEVGRRQDDLIKAILLTKEAIQKQPNQPLYHALLAQLAYRIGNHDLASGSIVTALSMWPEEPDWQMLAAKIYLAQNDHTSAIDHLEKAIRLAPDNPSYHQTLGITYLNIQNYSKAIEELEYLKQLSPENLQNHLLLAEAYLATKNLTKASEISEIALKMAPEDVTSILMRGKISLEEQDTKKAKQLATRALQIDSTNAEAYHILAQALYGSGQIDEALRIMERAIRLSENPLPLMLEKVKLLEKCEGNDAAWLELEKLIKQFPNNSRVIGELAVIQASRGEFEQAIKSAQQAIKTGNGNLTPTEQANLHYLLGKLLHQCGQLDQALHHLSEAIHLDPYCMDAYLILGQTQQEQRQYQSALLTYRKAIQAKPDDPRPYYQTSLILKETHDYLGAEEMLRRACDLAPNDLTIRRQLGALIAHNLIHNRQTSYNDA